MEFNKYPAEQLLGHLLDPSVAVTVVDLDRLVRRLLTAASEQRAAEIDAAMFMAAEKTGTRFVELSGAEHHELSTLWDDPYFRELVCWTYSAENGVCTCQRSGQTLHPAVDAAREKASQRWEGVFGAGGEIAAVVAFLRRDRRGSPFRRFWAGWGSLQKRSSNNIVQAVVPVCDYLGLETIDEVILHTKPSDPRRAAWLWATVSATWREGEGDFDPRHQSDTGACRVEVGVFNRTRTELTVFVSRGAGSVLHELVGQAYLG